MSSMLDPKTPAYRYRNRSGAPGVFHLDPLCPAVQRASKLRLGTLGGCLLSGRRMCKDCGVDPSLLPPPPVMRPLPTAVPQ